MGVVCRYLDGELAGNDEHRLRDKDPYQGDIGRIVIYRFCKHHSAPSTGFVCSVIFSETQ